MSLEWNIAHLREPLQSMLPGLTVEFLEQCPSTNTELLARARTTVDTGSDVALVRHGRESAAFGRRAADVQPCLLVTEHQTMGRGRMGRAWTASAGASLTFSLSIPLSVSDTSGLSLCVGIALAEAFNTLPCEAGLRIGLKWPNDLWLMDSPPGAPPRGRKLGGVLIETCPVGSHRIAVVGVGLNVRPQIIGELSQGYACLQELSAHMTAPAALALIARPLVLAVNQFNRTGFAGFALRYKALDVLSGHLVATTQSDAPQGTAWGVTDSGALQIQTDQGLRDLVSGEVSVRLHPPHVSLTKERPC